MKAYYLADDYGVLSGLTLTRPVGPARFINEINIPDDAKTGDKFWLAWGVDGGTLVAHTAEVEAEREKKTLEENPKNSGYRWSVYYLHLLSHEDWLRARTELEEALKKGTVDSKRLEEEVKKLIAEAINEKSNRRVEETRC